MSLPRVIILLSGKRKSGKDYIAHKLHDLIGSDKCTIVRISEPIKSHYAKENSLNLEELMSDNAYKETYRKNMIEWSDGIRKNDPGYFCKAACDAATKKLIWIVSDIRRKTDIHWFSMVYMEIIKTVRINADLKTRINRGWTYTEGVDNVASECDLDDYPSWTLVIHNNNETELKTAIAKILELVEDAEIV